MEEIYRQKSASIIKESIKSAIFIDEKAWTPFTSKSEEDIQEENLSKNLYESFKGNKISLSLHKLLRKELDNTDLIDYLFDDRDLVLLDWKLEGSSGEDIALEVLSKIIDRGNIHFCCLYTSEEDLDNVFSNILSFFSGKSADYYENLKLELADIEEEIKPLNSKFLEISHKRYDSDSGELVGRLFKSHQKLIQQFSESTGEKSAKEAIIDVSVAYSNTHKSSSIQKKPTLISKESKVLIIGHTIVCILKKEYEQDPKNLINRISEHVIKSKNSFTQLLGIEMQNIFDKTTSFVDSNLLNVSKNALLFHRNQMLEKDGLELPFKDLLKQVLLENAGMHLRAEDLTLLDNEFLDKISDKADPPEDNELVLINVFYNSTLLKEDNKVNFGDVFSDGKDQYFICITSLCDCLRPEKMDNTYYFAIGRPIKLDHALELGDTAFISYVSEKEIIRWSDVESEVSADLHKYKPVYIKPVPYFIKIPTWKEDLKLTLVKLDREGNEKKVDVSYKTTIRPNYVQRIANHAFSYPVRVGIDFVKKRNN